MQLRKWWLLDYSPDLQSRQVGDYHSTAPQFHESVRVSPFQSPQQKRKFGRHLGSNSLCYLILMASISDPLTNSMGPLICSPGWCQLVSRSVSLWKAGFGSQSGIYTYVLLNPLNQDGVASFPEFCNPFDVGCSALWLGEDHLPWGDPFPSIPYELIGQFPNFSTI